MGTTSATVNNETLSAVGTTGVIVANNDTSKYCFNDFVVVRVTNVTDGLIVSTGNYTYDIGSGRVKTISGTGYEGQNLNVTYTYECSTTTACSSLKDTNTAMLKIPSWLALIVIVLIAGILIFLVINSLAKRSLGAVAEI